MTRDDVLAGLGLTGILAMLLLLEVMFTRL